MPHLDPRTVAGEFGVPVNSILTHAPGVACVLIALAVGGCASRPTVTSAPQPAGAAAASGIHQLGFHSLGITADGRFITYFRADWQDGSKGVLWIRDVQSGTSQRVTADSFPQPIGPRPAWSPDGRLLAYFGFSNGRLRLRIWDRAGGREIHRSLEPACTSVSCTFWAPQWTPDGRLVLFVADTRVTAASMEDPIGGSDTRRAIEDELLGIVPAPTGVTVLTSPALDRRVPTAGPTPRDGRSVYPPTRIVALDVRRGEVLVLASGAPFVGIQVSADERVALAVAQERESLEFPQRSYSLYALSLPSRSRETPAPTPPLRVLASRVPSWQSGQSVSLAPSGRLLAYTTTGPMATGDVFVIDVERGTTRNLTADVRLSVNPLDARRDTTQKAHIADWHGKFGMAHTAPMWTVDEQAVLVVRPVARQSHTVPMRFELWTVPLDGGAASRVPSDTGFSIVGLPRCADRRVACVLRDAGEVVAKVRLLRGDTMAYMAIDPHSGASRVLRVIGSAAPSVQLDEYDFNAGGYEDFLAASKAGVVVGVEEAHDCPPELWLMDPSPTTPTASSLGALNPGPPPAHGAIQRVTWVSSTGDTLGALLRFPPGMRDGEPVPVIMVVYGAAYGSRDGGRFDGGTSWYSAFRYRGHFAVLTPDLPITKARNGPNCDDLTRHALDALDAAVKTGRIDGDRAGVIGHSWGGYTVTCLVTRTNRFRAAVSVAGISNLTSIGAAGRAFTHLANLYAQPWEDPQAYVRETPLFHLDKVRTPLLIIYGKRDLIQLNHAMEIYDGLLGLGQPVALVGYDTSGHVEMLRYPDFLDRVLEWFGTYFDRTGRRSP